jgi:hypothetical protein
VTVEPSLQQRRSTADLERIRVDMLDAWIGWGTPFDTALSAIGAKTVGDPGANVTLARVRRDGPLAFADKRSGITCVDPVRLYGDLARVGGPDHPLATSLREAIINR